MFVGMMRVDSVELLQKRIVDYAIIIHPSGQAAPYEYAKLFDDDGSEQLLQLKDALIAAFVELGTVEEFDVGACKAARHSALEILRKAIGGEVK